MKQLLKKSNKKNDNALWKKDNFKLNKITRLKIKLIQHNELSNLPSIPRTIRSVNWSKKNIGE